MKDAVEKVTEFHRATDLIVGDLHDPQLVDVALRLRLIAEEFDELLSSLDDQIEPPMMRAVEGWIEIVRARTGGGSALLLDTADALGDLIYVIVGAAISWGIPLEPVLAEIHRSNMTKIGGEKREDGKILKPEGYTPPDIGTAIAEFLKTSKRE